MNVIHDEEGPHLSRGRIEKGRYDKKRKVVTIWSRIVAVCVRREARGGSPRVLERERNGLSGWPSGPQRCAPTQCLRPAAPSQLAAAAPSPQHPRRPLPGSPVESRRATAARGIPPLHLQDTSSPVHCRRLPSRNGSATSVRASFWAGNRALVSMEKRIEQHAVRLGAPLSCCTKAPPKLS